MRAILISFLIWCLLSNGLYADGETGLSDIIDSTEDAINDALAGLSQDDD